MKNPEIKAGSSYYMLTTGWATVEQVVEADVLDIDVEKFRHIIKFIGSGDIHAGERWIKFYIDKEFHCLPESTFYKLLQGSKNVVEHCADGGDIWRCSQCNKHGL
jgi:hypothetical protein